MDWAAPFRIDVQSIYGIVVSAVILYVFIVAAVRILGVRSVSHLNNFDWIVVVAIGAITGSAILPNGVGVLQGVTAIAALFAVQYTVTWIAARSSLFADIIQERERVLVENGKVDRDLLAHERVTEDEILAEVRGKGLESFDQVKELVLESDSSVSVVPKDDTRQNASQNIALRTVEKE